MGNCFAPKIYIISKTVINLPLNKHPAAVFLGKCQGWCTLVPNRSHEMYGTVPGIPELPKIQRTSGCREVKRLAPKILIGLNPVMDDMAANALDGVCGTILTLWDFPWWRSH